MTTHTKGPWTQLTDDNGDLWVVADDAHQYHIANMEGSCPTCHANARLMAAAPDLLAALEEALNFIPSQKYPRVFKHLCGVVDKAKGKEM